MTDFDDLLRLHAAASVEGIRLNLGCGTDILDGWTNLDIADLPGVDIVHELGTGPIPLADGSVAVISARDILEHVDLIPVMGELCRVLQPGGVLLISTVHFTSRDFFVDPTHIRAFSARTFDFFVSGGGSGRDYYFDFGFQSLEQVIIDFPGGNGRFFLWNRLVKPFANRFTDVYEMTGLSRLFPAGNVLAVFRK